MQQVHDQVPDAESPSGGCTEEGQVEESRLAEGGGGGAGGDGARYEPSGNGEAHPAVASVSQSESRAFVPE